MSIWPDHIESAAKRIIATYSARGLMIATAESCTGGLVAGILTDIAGSSAVVDRGFVTYSNDAKKAMLGVLDVTLAAHGAVSRETALEMAAGALSYSKASVSIAVTGIAGPGGGSPGKPVGLVHLACTDTSGTILHHEMRYGDVGRQGVRLATVATALDMLAEIAGQRR